MTALASPATRERAQSWRWWLLLGLAAAAGIGLRLYVAHGVIGDPDSDEAIPALMVRHFLHGHLNVFYWGQAYGGTQEILLTVPLFWLFGASWTVLRLVPIALSAAACVVLWRAGLRLYGETAGRAAGALLWVWPPFAVYYLTHQYGFYASDVLYCALLVLLALRAVERPDVVRVAAFGLVLGLAFWETEQIVPVALPVIGWTIWRRPRVLRHAWAAAGAVVLGALPWLVWNARHDWASLNALPGGSTYWHRIRVFVSPLLPMMAGVRVPYSQKSILGPGALADLLFLALLALFAFGAVTAFRRRRTSDASLLYVVAAPLRPDLRHLAAHVRVAPAPVPRRAGARARAPRRAARDHVPAGDGSHRRRRGALGDRPARDERLPELTSRGLPAGAPQPRAAGHGARPPPREPGVRRLLDRLPARLRHAGADHLRRERHARGLVRPRRAPSTSRPASRA